MKEEMGKWTKEEIEKLRELYPTVKNREIAAKLGRSVSSIMHKAVELGLRKKGSSSSEGEGGSTSAPTPISIPIVKLTREEVGKRDEVDILRVCWSLVEQLQQELEKPVLSQRDRLKVMGTLSNATAVLFNVMRHIEAPEDEDLKEAFESVIRKYMRSGRYVIIKGEKK